MTSMRLVAGVLSLALLAGCAGMAGPPVHETPPSHAAMRQAAAALLDGIRRYDDGDFKGAIAALGTPSLQAAPDAMRAEALKYTAFSYCVLQDRRQCRQAFDQALAVDPEFALSKSEGGHPMWGPVFEAAKAASVQDHAHTSADTERERWRNIDLWRAR